MSDKSPIITAHRGYSSVYPENTRAAFEYSLEAGFTSIECDVHLTKDGQLVCFHDFTVSRTAQTVNGKPVKGNISEYTLKELKTLDVSSWKDTGRRSGIPKRFGSIEDQLVSLNELLEILIAFSQKSNLETHLALELKYHPELYYKAKDLVKTVDDVLTHYNYDKKTGIIETNKKRPSLINAPNVVITPMSFGLNTLHSFGELNYSTDNLVALFSNNPTIDKSWEIEARYFGLAEKHSIISPSLSYVLENEKEIRDLIDSGRDVRVWTVDDPAYARWLKKIGVSAITTNDPSAIKAAVG